MDNLSITRRSIDYRTATCDDSDMSAYNDDITGSQI